MLLNVSLGMTVITYSKYRFVKRANTTFGGVAYGEGIVYRGWAAHFVCIYTYHCTCMTLFVSEGCVHMCMCDWGWGGGDC